MGVVDRAGGAVGEDCNGGGARVDGVALASAVVDGESLERSASRAVVAYVEINNSADRNRGSGEGKESQGDEGAHVGDHVSVRWML
jgi:hypothetical protein